MGKQIYLSNEEIESLRDAATEWCSIMGDGDETAHLVTAKLEKGLGSALYKLYKGTRGEKVYQKYIKK